MFSRGWVMSTAIAWPLQHAVSPKKRWCGTSPAGALHHSADFVAAGWRSATQIHSKEQQKLLTSLPWSRQSMLEKEVCCEGWSEECSHLQWHIQWPTDQVGCNSIEKCNWKHKGKGTAVWTGTGRKHEMPSWPLPISRQQIKASRNDRMIYTSFPHFTPRQIKGELCNLIRGEKSIQAMASMWN